MLEVLNKKISSKNPKKGTVRTLHTVKNQNDKVVMTWISNFMIKTQSIVLKWFGRAAPHQW